MNWKIKVQNPAFWISMVIGIAVIIGTYFGISAPDLTSWLIVTNTLGAAIASPYVCLTILIYVLGLFIDLSTIGFKDSAVTIAKTSIDQTAQDVINLQLKQASLKAQEATALKDTYTEKVV
ncbi:MAG: hypothetical protein JJE18_04495 [Eubacteriaceae bacterium]|nr:hypothetical protein [Eubacteriaceae bacterium]